MHWTGSGAPRCLACRLPTYRRARPATRAWSAWELSLLRRRELSTREIQRRTGRSRLAINLKRWKAVGPEFTVREWTAAEDAAVLAAAEPDKELARRLGRTLGSIRTRRLNLRRPKAPRRGTILTEVHEVRAAALPECLDLTPLDTVG